MQPSIVTALCFIGSICIVGVLCETAEKPETCLEKVNELRYKMQTQPHRVPADTELPKCDWDGNYELKQCFGRWTGYGNCGCYKRYSGGRILKIRGVSARSPEAEQMTCQCAYDQIHTTWDLDCQEDTGDYKSVRCVQSRCFCAERTGEPIRGYRAFNKGVSNCQCAREEHDYKQQNEVTALRTWTCKGNGAFEPKQQHGNTVYCVNAFGHKITHGFHINSFHGKNLKCPEF